tara:strand:- start:34 stop:726 length:693 start_codon:yes stop_codon:yes gene_type:complete
MKHKKVNIVTCTDWNYRHWVETLLQSLKGLTTGDFNKKFVIAIGEGDWDQFAEKYNVTIIKEQWKDGEDRVLWCQNVRMKHLCNLIQDVHWLLQVDADVRQNKPMNTAFFKKYKGVTFANRKEVGKEMKPMVDRFKINAGWVLYKNHPTTITGLENIRKEFETYSNTPQWEQLMLLKYFPLTLPLPFKYVDEGVKGFRNTSHWFHCKGPGRKEMTDLNTWHDLTIIPQLT